MKTTSEFRLILTGMLILLSITGCTKKENPAPPNNNTSLPAVVYDSKNTAAIYPTTGMAVDASGNLYFAEANSNVIKMYTPAGQATIIAGSGNSGSANGRGTAASFYFPSALAIDAANNIYVADAANNIIREIDPQGNVSTIAGSGAIGFADGMNTSASFNFPQGIAVDNNGNVYVADTGNDLIRKISPGGMVSTLAGKVAKGNNNGTGAEALFNIPQGLTVDSQGNIYVADAGNNLVRKVTPTGVVTTLAGSGYAMSADGTGTQASFNFPDALTIDKTGNIYVTEAFSGNVRKINTANYVTDLGFVSIAFGVSINTGTLRVLDGPIVPNGIATDTHGYNVYVTDIGNNYIELF